MKRNLVFFLMAAALLLGAGAVFASSLVLETTMATEKKFGHVGHPYDVTISVTNTGDVVAWDTYVSYTLPEAPDSNYVVVGVNPASTTSPDVVWYIYNLAPGETRAFTVTVEPQLRGLNTHRVDTWYRAFNTPGTWVHDTRYLTVEIKGPK